MKYKSFGNIVDSCPRSRTERDNAASKLNCGVDKYGRNLYTCVPTADLTAVVEYCFKSTAGLYEKGTCLILVGDGDLDDISCTHFKEGCPKVPFRITDLYQYPACHNINAKDRCFYADPICPDKSFIQKSNENMMSFKHQSLIVPSFTMGLVSLVLVTVLIFFAVIYFVKKMKKGRYSAPNSERIEALLSYDSTGRLPDQNHQLYVLMLNCTETMRNFFHICIPPQRLAEVVISSRQAMKYSLSEDLRKKIYAYQDSSEPLQISSKDLNISAMYILLRNSLSVQPPSNGWGRIPEENQITEGDDLERIRQIRNILAHTKYDLDYERCKKISSDLTKVIRRLQEGILRRRNQL